MTARATQTWGFSASAPGRTDARLGGRAVRSEGVTKNVGHTFPRSDTRGRLDPDSLGIEGAAYRPRKKGEVGDPRFWSRTEGVTKNLRTESNEARVFAT